MPAVGAKEKDGFYHEAFDGLRPGSAKVFDPFLLFSLSSWPHAAQAPALSALRVVVE
jgi:hypothetical protein